MLLSLTTSSRSSPILQGHSALHVHAIDFDGFDVRYDAIYHDMMYGILYLELCANSAEAKQRILYDYL